MKLHIITGTNNRDFSKEVEEFVNNNKVKSTTYATMNGLHLVYIEVNNGTAIRKSNVQAKDNKRN